MEKLRKSAYWLIPVSIILAGFIIVFIVNVLRYSEPPSKNWSRALKIDEVDNFHDQYVVDLENQTNIYYVKHGKMYKKTFDKDYNEVNEEILSANLESVKDFIVINDVVYVLRENNLVNSNTGEMIDQADSLTSTENDKIVYTKGQEVLLFDPNTQNSSVIFQAGHKISGIQSSGDYILVYGKESHIGKITIYSIKDDKQVVFKEVDVGLNNYITSIQFITNGENIHVAMAYESESKNNKQYYFDLTEFNVHNPELDFVRIAPTDPVTGRSLQEVSDFTLNITQNKLVILFRSVGFTYTDTNDSYAMNIYSLSENDDGKLETTRLSNSYKLKENPFFIGKHAVGWTESNQIYLSSTNENVKEMTKKISSDEYFIAFGMSVAKMATAAFILYLAVTWLIIPVIYLLIVSFINRLRGRNRDFSKDQKVFYIGSIIYIISSLMMRKFIFPENGLRMAPDYLTFTGSSIFYILLFAIIAFAAVMFIKRDWGTIGKYFYFIGLQYLCYYVFLGPFYF
jgi:hypothetical protein